MTVFHKQIYRRAPFGGLINRTLCGRVSGANDDNNVALTDAHVTCKLCRKLIGTPRDNGLTQEQLRVML